jgi:DNA repair protein RadA/Sms
LKETALIILEFFGLLKTGLAQLAVLAALEGSRPVLVEVQALVVASGLATPRRAVIGWDSGRLAMVMAVLEARCGIQFSGSDVFLNIAGGMRINEPAADLAVAAALVSSLHGKAVPPDTIFFGEIGLSGEIRQISRPDLRLKEALKLGFKTAYIPKGKRGMKKDSSGVDVKEINHVDELLELFRAQNTRKKYAQS